MNPLIVSVTLAIVCCFSFSKVICQSDNSNNSGNNNVTQNYIPQNVLNQTTSARIAASQLNCTGDPGNPFMPGMFQYDGDMEPFINSSHGGACTTSCTFCVSSDYLNTHAIATLQDNSCTTSAWKVSHGTPEIGINQNNHFIHLWSGDWSGDGDFEGEGVFYDCELIACVSYKISLRLSSSSTISNIYFYIASGLQHKIENSNIWNSESAFYKVPNVTKSYLIHSITNFNSGLNTWIDIDLPVFTPPESGMKLWVFTADNNNISQEGLDLLFIDDVTDGLPGSNSTCTGNVNYTSTPIPAFTKANTITASASTTLASTEFIGGATVTLQPGFSVLSSSTFYASIVPCANGNNCPQGCPNCRNSNTTIQNRDPVQLKNDKSFKLNVHPNPSNGEMTIEKPLGEKITSVKLIAESTGREVGFLSYEDFGNSINFKIGNFQKGMLIIHVETEKHNYTARIIIY